MKRVGMYGGSFNPPHIGHVNAIIEASNMCEKLYVVLYATLDPKEIDHRERYMWLKQITHDMPNIEVIEIFDNSRSKKEYSWEAIKEIKETIDIVFCGNDYKGKNIFEKIYPNSEIYYFDRSIIDVSSTQIRENPFKYYDYIPNVVKPYYNKKVVLIGTESCGKSTLVRNLAKVYNTNYVEEVGRDICEEAGGIDNMQSKHFVEIIHRHKIKEMEGLKTANKVLFIDTEALITLYYYKLSFENTSQYNPDFVNLANVVAKLNDYDLCIFLEPDVTWVQDGTRIYGEEEVRKKNNALLKQMLKDMNINYEIISGDYHERFVKSKKLVNKLLYKNEGGLYNE